MSLTVAIMGRPNVGKSTLFNRLVGRKIALVDDQPGVTRDRREGEARLGDLRFRVFDTAGLDDIRGESLEARMSAQAETAVEDSDVVLFVIDARAGVTPTDREFAGRVRRKGKPVILVANKAEGRGQEAGVLEGFQLGFGEPLGIRRSTAKASTSSMTHFFRLRRKRRGKKNRPKARTGPTGRCGSPSSASPMPASRRWSTPSSARSGC